MQPGVANSQSASHFKTAAAFVDEGYEVRYPQLRQLAYNELMARGWESKSVEQQMSAAEDRQHDKDKAAVTASEIERRKRKQGLMLERGRITREMEQAHKRRYLVLLERALNHVEAELAKLEKADST